MTSVYLEGKPIDSRFFIKNVMIYQGLLGYNLVPVEPAPSFHYWFVTREYLNTNFRSQSGKVLRFAIED